MFKCRVFAVFVCIAVLSLFFAGFVSSKTVMVPKMEWERSYGPLEGYSVVQTADGGYAIAGQYSSGYVYSFSGGSYSANPPAIIKVEFHPIGTGHWANRSATLIKVDASGNVEWNKTYDNDVGGGFYAYSVVQTADTGYALFGTQSRLTGAVIFVVRTDSNGNIEWNSTVGWNNASTSFGDVILTSDGGYFITGSSRLNDSVHGFGWILKTDEYGNPIWNRTFGDNWVLNYGIRAVAEAEDGGYLIAGYWKKDFWFAKIDINGNFQWNQTYTLQYTSKSGSSYHANCISKDGDGGYILGGGNYDMSVLVKTDSEGVMEWNQGYAEDTTIMSVVHSTDGDGYLAAGYIGTSSGSKAWFVRVDDSGDLLWNSTLPTHNKYARTLIKTSDGGYATIGTVDDKIWLVKFTQEQLTIPDEEPPPLSPFPSGWLVLVVVIVAISGVFLGIHYKNAQNRNKKPTDVLLEENSGAGGGSRARDFWAPIGLGDCSPDHESGAITRLGYPGKVFFASLMGNSELRFSGIKRLLPVKV